MAGWCAVKERVLRLSDANGQHAMYVMKIPSFVPMWPVTKRQQKTQKKVIRHISYSAIHHLTENTKGDFSPVNYLCH